MPALSDNQFGYLRSAVKTLAERMAATVTPPAITHEELVDMFTPPEYREMFKLCPHVTTAYQGYGGVTVSAWPDTEIKGLSFHLNRRTGRSSPFLPSRPKLQPDANPETVAAITQWINHCTKTGQEFGLVAKFLEHLNEICKSPQQMRYLWPSLLGLAKVNEETASLATRIEKVSVPNTLPPVSPPLRELCRQCSTIVSSALLFDTGENEAQTRPEVSITIEFKPYHHEYLGPYVSI